jgi:LysR family glycine cleavage system transcriptional activator
MKRSLFPSLHAIMAFESAARHGGIIRASQELHLSQSAVSRLVRQVEETVQVKLFDRVRQRLILTDAGKTYAREMRKILSEMEQMTLQLMAYGSGGSGGNLNLGVFSTFGSKWLIPKLEDFKRRAPNVTVSCYVRSKPFSFDDDPLDAAIHFGEASWANSIMDPLFSENLVPVASPYLSGIGSIKSADDLLRFPLLHEVTRPWAWHQWFEQELISISDSILGARYDQFQMVAEAAKAGLGIALLPRFLFEQELVSGELFLPINKSLESDGMYYFVYPQRSGASPALIAFREWLLEIASKETSVPRSVRVDADRLPRKKPRAGRES